MGIIAILAGVIIIAINPARQFAQARNTQRQSNLEKIQGALNQYAIEGNGSFPSGVSTTLQMIGTAVSGCNISCGPDTILQIISSFLDDSQSEFAAGIFNNTMWNGGVNAVTLNAAGLTNKTGNYISGTKDAGAEQTWNSFSWTPTAPYTKELPNSQQSEAGYPAGNANMSGNVLLMHMNDSAAPVVDSSGSGNNGMVTSMNFGQTGKLNNALSFNGSAGYVQSPNTASLRLPNTAGAVALWIKPTVNLPQTTGMGIVRKPDYNPNWTGVGGYGLEIARPTLGGNQVLKGQLGYNSGLSNNTQTITGTTNIVSGTWNHVALAWNTTTAWLYLNGALEATLVRNGSATLSWQSTGGGSPLIIGHQYAAVSAGTTSYQWFNGLMDELAIFNRTLTGTEISSMYKRGALRLRAQIRTCDEAACNGETFKGPAGTSSDYYSELMNSTLGMPNLPITSQIPGRWFEYQMFFDTDTSSYGPELRTVSASNNGASPLNPTTEMTAATCLDLSALAPTQIESIPFDPQTGNLVKTYYAIKKVNTSNIAIRACTPELGRAIEIKQ